MNIELVQIARAHTIYIITENCRQYIQSQKLSSATAAVLDKLLLLFGLNHLSNDPSGLIVSGILTSEQVQVLDTART